MLWQSSPILISLFFFYLAMIRFFLSMDFSQGGGSLISVLLIVTMGISGIAFGIDYWLRTRSWAVEWIVLSEIVLSLFLWRVIYFLMRNDL